MGPLGAEGLGPTNLKELNSADNPEAPEPQMRTQPQPKL